MVRSFLFRVLLLCKLKKTLMRLYGCSFLILLLSDSQKSQPFRTMLARMVLKF